MAISLSLEAAELLEFMQWRNGEDLNQELHLRKAEIGEELSDILYWTLLIAHDLEIKLSEAFVAKMTANETKYPIEQSRGSSKKYTQLQSDPQLGGTT
jgi:NTP pyrophosphatase (non-canonical NTP hydrolase)